MVGPGGHGCINRVSTQRHRSATAVVVNVVVVVRVNGPFAMFVRVLYASARATSTRLRQPQPEAADLFALKLADDARELRQDLPAVEVVLQRLELQAGPHRVFLRGLDGMAHAAFEEELVLAVRK